MVWSLVVDAAECRRRGRAVPKIIDHRNSGSRSGKSSGGGDGSSSSPGGGTSPPPPRNPVTSPDDARCKNIFSLSTAADKKKKRHALECVRALTKTLAYWAETIFFYFYFFEQSSISSLSRHLETEHEAF